MQHGNGLEHRTILLGESQTQTTIADGELFEIKVDVSMRAALCQGIFEGTWGQTGQTFGGLGPGDSGPFGPCLRGLWGSEFSAFIRFPGVSRCQVNTGGRVALENKQLIVC